MPEPYTRRSAEAFVASAVRADPARRLEWAIVHEGRVSGGIELRFRDDFERLTGPGAAEVGYSLARPLWGRGLVTEAVSVVIGHGFGTLRLARIWACADVRNVASSGASGSTMCSTRCCGRSGAGRGDRRSGRVGPRRSALASVGVARPGDGKT